MNVGVFCSAAEVDSAYIEAARTFGKLIAERGHALVWGGSNVGLMREIAESVQKNGGKLIGVSVSHFEDVARGNADEIVVAKDLAERKALLLHKSDALVALVGGTGTLDEITEMMELKKYGTHDKPVVILNTGGFYDGLRTQFERMAREGFLYFSLEKTVVFLDTPEEVIHYIEESARERTV